MFQNMCSGNHHNQLYRSHIQQAGLQKGEITAILRISEFGCENQSNWTYQL